MGKTKIGVVGQTAIVQGDVNLLKKGELLLSTTGEYPVLRKRLSNGAVKIYVVIPLEDIHINTEVKEETKPEVNKASREFKDNMTYGIKEEQKKN